MKIIEYLKLEGCPVEIPDYTRNDLPEFFKELGLKVGAEIGVDRGHYSEVICQAGLKLFSIDPWLAYKDYAWLKSDQSTIEKSYQKAKQRLLPYDCTIIRKTSMEAVNDFEDGSLDFVYIDGNHSFKTVTEDIYEWSKKVRKGGVISGHDYFNDEKKKFHSDVKYVLDSYTKAAHIKKWFVLKKNNDTSWFWINI
jgi:hypothetical protein